MNQESYTPEKLQTRLKNFVVRVIKLTETFPKTPAGFRVAGQLIDSAGSIGANYSEALAARSKKEFVAICGVILKEAKETTFWLEVVRLANLIREPGELNDLIRESNEFEKIFAKTILTSSQNM